jgi:hypothetical protein
MELLRSITTGVPLCTHGSTATELLPCDSQHYAKLKCADCGAFLRFLPKPENAAKWKLNGYKLTKLQMAPGLNQWEREFVQTLAKLGNSKLTPKQQAVFDRLVLTHLNGRAA